jgi:hypothetical protein
MYTRTGVKNSRGKGVYKNPLVKFLVVVLWFNILLRIAAMTVTVVLPVHCLLIILRIMPLLGVQQVALLSDMALYLTDGTHPTLIIMIIIRPQCLVIPIIT